MTAIIEQVTVKDKSESRLAPQEKVDQQFADKDTDTHAVVVEEQEKLRHEILHSRHDLTNFDCYESAARHFSQSCFSIAKVCVVSHVRRTAHDASCLLSPLPISTLFSFFYSPSSLRSQRDIHFAFYVALTIRIHSASLSFLFL